MYSVSCVVCGVLCTVPLFLTNHHQPPHVQDQALLETGLVLCAAWSERHGLVIGGGFSTNGQRDVRSIGECRQPVVCVCVVVWLSLCVFVCVGVCAPVLCSRQVT
jgi:hypothetical protein